MCTNYKVKRKLKRYMLKRNNRGALRYSEGVALEGMKSEGVAWRTFMLPLGPRCLLVCVWPGISMKGGRVAGAAIESASTRLATMRVVMVATRSAAVVTATRRI